MRKLKVLFLASNPRDTSRLALDEEIRLITEKIRASDCRDFIDLISSWAVRTDDLLQALNTHKPDIVHFSGHGNNKNELILTNQSGYSQVVNSQALKALFHSLKDNIRVVLLNACYSYEQTKYITEVIDCAIGMNTSVGDSAAIIFAASFYRAIGFGRSLYEAFEQGKVALMLEGITDYEIPEMQVRNGVDIQKIFLLNSDDTVRHQIIPKPIARYLQDFPEFHISYEIASGYVRTSRESFFSALTHIVSSLTEGEEIISTDSIHIERSFILYWVTEGLEILRLNYEAALRGVVSKRVFLVSRQDKTQHRAFLKNLFKLHSMSGAFPILVEIDILPPECLREFVLLGDALVDEVIYDVRSINVIDNYIHWTSHKLAYFREKAKFITAHANPLPDSYYGQIATSFSEVLTFSKQLRKKFEDYI